MDPPRMMFQPFHVAFHSSKVLSVSVSHPYFRLEVRLYSWTFSSMTHRAKSRIRAPQTFLAVYAVSSPKLSEP